MSTRERPADHGRRLVRTALTRLFADIRGARVAAGLSQREVAAAVGTSHSRLGRLERGEIPNPPPDLLGAVCAVVGLDLAIRAYPSGDPLRDRAHTALLERLRRRLGPTLRWGTETPLPIPGDRRAWDGTIEGHGWRCRVEAETAVTDGQALIRRLSLKARDGGPGYLGLLVADTRLNRDALATLRPSLHELVPLESRAVLRALKSGIDPGGSGVVIL